MRVGVSIDQVIARQVGHLTRLPSLEISCDNKRQSSGCDSGYSCACQYNISWSSPTTPATAESNPRLVFERLFGTGAPGECAENARPRQQEQRSLLDFVREDARAMQRRLDARDKDKLDQYLTGLREIETRIQKSEQFGPVKDPGLETPPGIPSDHAEYVGLMYDLMVMAFQTDSTRVASFCLAHDGDNRSFAHLGIPEDHHQNKRRDAEFLIHFRLSVDPLTKITGDSQRLPPVPATRGVRDTKS